jgi:hypothetical protein
MIHPLNVKKPVIRLYMSMSFFFSVPRELHPPWLFSLFYMHYIVYLIEMKRKNFLLLILNNAQLIHHIIRLELHTALQWRNLQMKNKTNGKHSHIYTHRKEKYKRNVNIIGKTLRYLHWCTHAHIAYAIHLFANGIFL